MKAHAKSLLNIARHTQGKFLFRERKSLVPGQFQPLVESGFGKISSESPLKFIQTKLGQSCLGFRHSMSGGAARLPMLAATPHSIFGDSSRKSMRKSGWGFRTRSGLAAFTLVEVMMSAGIMVLFTAACLSSVVVNQVSVRKSKEEAIAMDFLTKYTENIKALPFTAVIAGFPINNLYNGASGALLIAIPANGTWVPLNSNTYQTFYPDLLWLNNRNPKMLVTMTQNIVSGTLHDIQINIKVDWDPPLSKGGTQEVEVDFLRSKDTSQL